MALTHITLRDFVIVRELELDLNTGFGVLTGETGAGKSILIDALQLALGARAETSVVREGASRCEVCAEFEPTPAVAAWLNEAGFVNEASLLLRRTVDTTGKSRAWINGSPATATQLRELGEHLLDIHGQHAWQSLTRPDAVRGLLDAYASIDTRPLKAAWHAWRLAQQTLADAQQAQSTLANERERLAWQIGELDKLKPAAGEWEDISTQHSRLANAQALIDAANETTLLLEGDDEGGALRQLSRAIQSLQALGHVEPEFNALAEVLLSAQAQAEDVAHSLHSYLRKTDLDPQTLAELDERMGLWLSLARRYKKPPEELPQVLAQWRDDLARLDAAADLDVLQKAEQAAHLACLQAAKQVSAQRQKAAKPLAKAVTAAMQQLGMQGGRFEVSLQTLDAPAQHGLEEVSFLVAGHEGSTPRPVGKVASGGELSRIALAIAVTTSELGEAGTLIFDEVDSGVGGAVAETVGRLMKQLGQHRQVLAVTHLPQVAACADHHLLVSKAAAQGQVSSQVRAVSGEERVSEIARMLGGEKLSATTLAHAREMLGTPQG
ncbi:DNA repair protein RecN [Limnohabitans sp. MMS-10A-160]|uniref:DNA repair protein RecN n=1 Tax=unclassified Limnohabitans TaxID=2626134 RepID=UPI000D3CBD1E|nr:MULTISPECIES: DNA repair protein RecN [unclassified Limnohabitans]PUE19617.1 DNA repair protein RecN [Limnohabitans sp. MMS-10A-192]PUE26978.1 DNA repair protein RecN [Limnohabitans sp. MMS-10A-160]